MAITSNMILEGLRGQLGKAIVVRRVGKNYVVSSYPSKKREYSERQLENQRRFARATELAQELFKDDAQRKLYDKKAKRRGGTSNALAVATGEFRRKLKLGLVV